jgi:four helix bundle protein
MNDKLNNMENHIKIDKRTFSFALQIVDLYKYLVKIKKEFILSKQLLRSGTSIGANVEEAQAAQSKKDFISKMSIVRPVELVLNLRD